MYDIVIVGAGPAGATLARLISKQYRVLLLDKRNLLDKSEEGIREKSCGGLLAPDAQNMLARLGLGVPQEILVGPQIFTVRTIDFDNNIERYYQRNYINIDREKFDRWLVELVPSSVDIKCDCIYKGHIDMKDYIEIKYLQDGKEFKVKTKLLVGADGGFSKVRRELANNNSKLSNHYISVQEWYDYQGLMPYFFAMFDKEVTDFYSWIIPERDYIIVGSAISVKDNVNDRFNLLKRKLNDYGIKLNKPFKKRGAYIIRPKKSEEIFIGKDKVALIGEAAGFISPSSAEGVSYAFKSALNLATSLLENKNHFLQSYNKRSNSLRRNILIKNMKSPFMYNQTMRKMVMKTGVASMNVIEEKSNSI